MKNKTASAVLDRLQILFGVDSDSDLCKAINVNRATLGTWRVRNSVPYSLCVKVAEEKGASLDWLLTGEGEMYRTETQEPRLNPISDQRAEKIVELYEALSETQQKEILAVIEEKKRMNQLEERLDQLQKKIG